MRMRRWDLIGQGYKSLVLMACLVAQCMLSPTQGITTDDQGMVILI